MIGLSVVFLAVSPMLVEAATVSVTITVTVSEAGAPSFTWMITGCGASPSSGTSGTPQSVTLNPSCAYTISSGSSTGNGTLRDLLTDSYLTSVQQTSCPSGTCPGIDLSAHVQEYLAISPNCNTPTTSPPSPLSDRWYNYGTTVSVSCKGVWGRSGGVGNRATSWNWDGGTNTVVATTSTIVSSTQTLVSHHAFNVNIMTQYQLTLDAGGARALAAVTSPSIISDKYWYDSGTAVTYVGHGAFGRGNGAGNRSVSWYVDSGTPSVLSTTANFSVPLTMSSPHVIHVTTKPQWQISLNTVALKFLNSITSPTLANDRYWYDTGTQVTVILNGTGTRSGGIGSRLVSYSINGGTTVPVAQTGVLNVVNSMAVGGPLTIVAVSSAQFQLTLDPGAAGAAVSVTPPPIAGDSYWYDSGTHVVFVGKGAFARASGTGTRISSWWWDSSVATPLLTSANFTGLVTMTSPHAIHSQTVFQFEVTLTGNYGVDFATNPTIAGDNYWYDSGTVISLSLQGIFGRAGGTGWRTISYSVNGGPGAVVDTMGAAPVLSALKLTSPQTVSVTAVRQYQVVFDGGIFTALNYITSPTFAGDNYWYDSGSAITLTAHGVWGRTFTQGNRLSSFSVNGNQSAQVASTGLVTVLDLAAIAGPQTITSDTMTQYVLTVNGGGTHVYDPVPPIGGDTGWYDSGSTVRVSTTGTYGEVGGTRQRVSSWDLDGGAETLVGNVPSVTTSSILMNEPHTVTFHPVTQYEVTIGITDNGGLHSVTPDSLLVNVNGGTEVAVGGYVWADSGSTVSVASVYWHGVDVAPTPAAVYQAASPFSIAVKARIYDATIAVKDPLGLAVGGADASITLVNGTSFQATTAGDGTITLSMVPLGRYTATVTALGVSSSLSGDASVEETGVVQVPLSWALIIALVLIAAAVLIGLVLFIRRRRRGIPSPEV
jgi:hypothetical protein